MAGKVGEAVTAGEDLSLRIPLIPPGVRLKAVLCRNVNANSEVRNAHKVRMMEKSVA